MPELLLFEHLTGLPYGQCSACNQKFELVMIGSEEDNWLELHTRFVAHLDLAHRQRD